MRPSNLKRRTYTSLPKPRRSQLAFAGALTLFFIIFVFIAVNISIGSALRTVSRRNSCKAVTIRGLQRSQIRGLPTESFWSNLQDDTKYITGWSNIGWTNDFMSYVNLIYLGMLTKRTVVLPPFAPMHVESAAGFVDVGDVFDLPRLSFSVGSPIIQWSDLKLAGSENIDKLGCWSVWATSASEATEKSPKPNNIETFLGLDVSYTPVPEESMLLRRSEYSNDSYSRFSSLAALAFPDGRSRLDTPATLFPGRLSGHRRLPDEQMACFDFPHYVSSEMPYEYEFDFSPAWRFVGTHAHWTPQLHNIALEALRQTFALGEDDDIPPFISLHIRHGDLEMSCKDARGSCFAPLRAFASQVEEVREEILQKHGIHADRVIVTSDETDPLWWEAVHEMGWDWVDHAQFQTEERFGRWYTVFIDVAVQSLGTGFVGTDKSTMSLLAQRRVEDWNGGVTRKWSSSSDFISYQSPLVEHVK